MSDEMLAFVRAFATLFAVANALPILPTVMTFTQDLPPRRARTVRNEALLAGTAVAAVFVIAGPTLFRSVGVTVDDLRIAGGLVLLVFAIYDLLFSRAERKQRAVDDQEDLESSLPEVHDSPIVPLGIPILVGPATLSSALVLAGTTGIPTVLGCLALNLMINAALLTFGDRLLRRISPAYTRAVGKVMSLFLAAIAVSMIRAGIHGFVGG